MQAGHGSAPGDVGVSWLHGKGSWLFYIGLLAAVRHVLGLLPGLPPHVAWSVLNIGHAALTFVTFHWLKGSPFPTYWSLTPAGVDACTWWEQLDRRWQQTPARKFCVAVVLALWVLAVEATPAAAWGWHAANGVAFGVVFVAKLPWRLCWGDQRGEACAVAEGGSGPGGRNVWLVYEFRRLSPRATTVPRQVRHGFLHGRGVGGEVREGGRPPLFGWRTPGVL